MVWVRLDDGFPSHPKAIRVGPLGRDLFTCALCYSNRYLTDGFIPEHALFQIAPGLPNPKRVAATLVEAGFWETCDGGWRIHDYHGFQPSASEVRAVQERALAIRSAGGRARAATATRVGGRFAPAAPAGDQQAAGDSVGDDGHQQHQQETSSVVPAETSSRPVPSRIKYLAGDSAPAESDASPKEPKGNGRDRSTRKTDPETDFLLRDFAAAFEAKLGEPYLIEWGRDRKLMGGLVATYGAASVRAKLAAFFEHGTRETRDRRAWTVPEFRRVFPQLVAMQAMGDLG
jgi:hypothetical protein